MKNNDLYLLDATNVYRTKNYIVKQIVKIKQCCNDNIMFSEDTFYKRNKVRDKQYEQIFKNRTFIQGKRLPSTAYTRRYID